MVLRVWVTAASNRSAIVTKVDVGPGALQSASVLSVCRGTHAPLRLLMSICRRFRQAFNCINLERRKSDEGSGKKPQKVGRTGAAVISRRKPSARVTPNDPKSVR